MDDLGYHLEIMPRLMVQAIELLATHTVFHLQVVSCNLPVKLQWNAWVPLGIQAQGQCDWDEHQPCPGDMTRPLNLLRGIITL